MIETDSKGKAKMDDLVFTNDRMYVTKTRFLYPNHFVVMFNNTAGVMHTSGVSQQEEKHDQD